MKRSEFASALKLLLPGIETGGILEGAETFMFCGEWIKSHNGRITIAFPYSTEFRGSVQAMEFWRVLEKMKSEDFSLEMDGESLRVVSGDADLKMTIMPLPAHADFPIPTEWKPLPENFMEAVKLVSLSVDSNPILGILGGLFVNGKDMLSCDFHHDAFPDQSLFRRTAAPVSLCSPFVRWRSLPDRYISAALE